MHIGVKIGLGVSVVTNIIVLYLFISMSALSVNAEDEISKQSVGDQENLENIDAIYENEILNLLHVKTQSTQNTSSVSPQLYQAQHQHTDVVHSNHPEMILNAALVTDSLIYGSEDARFKIVSFADIECPHCRRIHSQIKAVVDYAPDHVNWEFKHFPLTNNNPEAVSQAAMVECTFQERGNQWAWLMLGELIKHTQGNGRGQRDYVAFAEHVRVEPEWLVKCVQNRQHQIAVENDYKEGRALGVSGTPTLFVTDTMTGKTKRLEQFQTSEQIASTLFELSQ